MLRKWLRYIADFSMLIGLAILAWDEETGSFLILAGISARIIHTRAKNAGSFRIAVKKK